MRDWIGKPGAFLGEDLKGKARPEAHLAEGHAQRK